MRTTLAPAAQGTTILPARLHSVCAPIAECRGSSGLLGAQCPRPGREGQGGEGRPAPLLAGEEAETPADTAVYVVGARIRAQAGAWPGHGNRHKQAHKPPVRQASTETSCSR
jgi:hypothetical protein